MTSGQGGAPRRPGRAAGGRGRRPAGGRGRRAADRRGRRPALACSLVLAAFAGWACAGTAGAPSAREEDEGYLRRVAFEMPGHESVVLRWPKREMPLAVYLPRPPPGLFEDPEAIFDSVRGGVLDWTDVAGPGIPSFVFVDEPGEADIPILWAERAAGEWYIAFCKYQPRMQYTRRFAVAHILVTARWGGGRVADIHDIYDTMLHEMGHALGLGGHSDRKTDVMYARGRKSRVGLSERDRITLRALYTRPIGSRVLGARSRH